MQCPHCAAENPIHQVFCSTCGKKIGVSFHALADSVHEDEKVDKLAVVARALLPIAVLTALLGAGVWLVSSRFGVRPRYEKAPSACPPPPVVPVAPAEKIRLPDVPGAAELAFLPLPPPGGETVMKLGFRRKTLSRAIHAARGGAPSALEAVERGLASLCAHQYPDGSWKAKGQWEGGRLVWGNVGVTSLAVLALLGNGHVWTEPGAEGKGPLGQAAGRGVRFLVESQAAGGRVGPATGNYMYNHGMATAALAEAYAMSGLPPLRVRAARACHFLLAAQRPSGGWDYTERPGRRTDISVTAWQVAALRAARLAGVASPELDTRIDKALKLAAAYVNGLTSPTTGETGYESRPTSGRELQHPTLGPTAMALACREAIASAARGGSAGLRAEVMKPALVKMQLGVLLRKENLPRWDPAWAKTGARKEPHMFYYWYHGSMGMRVASGEQWRTWSMAAAKAILAGQQEDGSWPKVGLWAQDGGRVYVTALAVLTLEAAYRYP